MKKRVVDRATSHRLVAMLMILAGLPGHADVLDDYLLTGAGSNAPRPAGLERAAPYWIDDPEFRFAPEKQRGPMADPWRQTYSFRFRPVGPRERRATRALFDIDNAIMQLEHDEFAAELLADRYQRVIDLASLEVRLAILHAQLEVDGLELESEQSLSTAEFSAARLQNAALRLELRRQTLQDVQARTEALRAATVADFLRVVDPAKLVVSPELITPERIALAVRELVPSSFDGRASIETELAKLEFERAQSRLTQEKRRRGFGLDLLEVAYEDRLVDSYNFTVGFRLPLTRYTPRSQNRLRDVIEAEQELTARRLETTATIEDLVREVDWRTLRHAQRTTALQRLNAGAPQTLAAAAAAPALRRYELELQALIADGHIRILRDYVELLEVIGRLPDRPLDNWIDGDGES